MRTPHSTRFGLDSEGLVTQEHTDGSSRRFDPHGFGLFQGPNGEVRAVRIPGSFRVGPEQCRDGYLVFDGKLKAVSAQTFSRDYTPAGHVLGERAA